MTRVAATSVTLNESAYRNCNTIVDVDLHNVPFYLNSMNYSFRNCNRLVNVYNINSDVKNMNYTFSNCTNMKDPPVLPENLISMAGTFSNCVNLVNEPSIPSTVRNVEYAFNRCNNMKDGPNLPDGITSLSYTFYNCQKMYNVPEIPISVTNMSYAFYNCTNMKEVRPIHYGVTNIAYCYAGEGQHTTPYMNYTDVLTIPDTVIDMSGVFKKWKKLETAPEIPHSVISVSETFKWCESLTTPPPIIPNSITDMSYIFDGCNKLETTPTLEEPCIIINMRGSYRETNISTAYIPEGVTDISYTFYNCDNIITAPVIPTSVKFVDSTFSFCGNLEAVPSPDTYLPDGITSMPATFLYCSKLTVPPKIPDSVTSMINTFSYCSSLIDRPNIPENVTNIAFVFHNSKIISNIQSPLPTNITDMSFAFSGYQNILTDFPDPLPSKLVNFSGMFASHSEWIDDIPDRAWELYESVPLNIRKNSSFIFNACTKLTTVNNDKLVKLANFVGVFEECRAIADTVVLPDNATNIHKAFYQCSNLKYPSRIPNSATDIGYLYGLTGVIKCPIIPNGVTSMSRTLWASHVSGNVYVKSPFVASFDQCFWDTSSNLKNVYIPYKYPESMGTLYAWYCGNMASINTSGDYESTIYTSEPTITSGSTLYYRNGTPYTGHTIYVSSSSTAFKLDNSTNARYTWSRNVPNDIANNLYTKSYNAINSAGYFGTNATRDNVVVKDINELPADYDFSL